MMMSSQGVSQSIIDRWQQKPWQRCPPLITGSHKSPEHTLCGVRNGPRFSTQSLWNRCKNSVELRVRNAATATATSVDFTRIKQRDGSTLGINSAHVFFHDNRRALIQQLDPPATHLTTCFTLPSSRVRTSLIVQPKPSSPTSDSDIASSALPPRSGRCCCVCDC